MDDSTVATTQAPTMQLATLRDVSGLIKFVTRNFADGLAILLGTATPPSSVEIGDAMHCGSSVLSNAERYGTRVDGGERVPHAQVLLENRYEETVAKLGGWAYLSKSLRDFRTAYPETWALFEMYALFIKRGGMMHSGNGGAYGLLVERCDGADSRTVRRRLGKIIQTMALYVLTREDAPTLRDIITRD